MIGQKEEAQRLREGRGRLAAAVAVRGRHLAGEGRSGGARAETRGGRRRVDRRSSRASIF